MSVDGNHGEDLNEEQEHVKTLKQEKPKDKSVFTRIKNKLLNLLDEQDHPSRREIKEICKDAKCKSVLWKRWENYRRIICSQRTKKNAEGWETKWKSWKSNSPRLMTKPKNI